MTPADTAHGQRHVSASHACDHHRVKSDLSGFRASSARRVCVHEAVRADAGRESLAAAARTVANARRSSTPRRDKALHSGVESAWMPLDHLTERTEVLAELWLDLARAYQG